MVSYLSCSALITRKWLVNKEQRPWCKIIPLIISLCALQSPYPQQQLYLAHFGQPGTMCAGSCSKARTALLAPRGPVTLATVKTAYKTQERTRQPQLSPTSRPLQQH